ncbi:hypothetical protein [Saccharibacillus alkalitolerans]|uniref:Uncharacterized protein n=1 Tax=Saccharibacillus alkalitolerans TaxID=2705290 RepID=A0ABX0F497_9BACL|nr:hypothetical protein [Saccharibacillus alkalitolerans]NGZ74700.1 hypothetical protein [Saccharibacillus alkalitolerans]
MRLKELKDTMLLPDREILLNRLVNVEDIKLLLMSSTSENGTHKLWTLSPLPERSSEEKVIRESEESLSNRELMQRDLKRETIIGDQERFISQMIIQGRSMTFSSSQSTYFMEPDYRTYMELQHFIEKGLDLAGFEDMELERLVLTCYEQDSSEAFPDLDLDQELDITLKFAGTVRTIPVHTEPIMLNFGDSSNEIKHYYYDPVHEKNRFFYVHAWTRYDIWGETQKRFENPAEEGFTEEEWQRFKEQSMKSNESVCSKDQVIALVEYESEDNLQLNFYAQDYLDAKPIRSSGMSSTVLFFASDHELGPHGLKSRVDSIGPIDKTVEGDIIVELMSYYKELPEKTVKL